MRKAASRLASLIFPGVMCGEGSGVGDGVGVVPELPQLTLGFCAGHERERQAEEGEKKSVHVLCL